MAVYGESASCSNWPKATRRSAIGNSTVTTQQDLTPREPISVIAKREPQRATHHLPVINSEGEVDIKRKSQVNNQSGAA
jgi:hypothetical protein